VLSGKKVSELFGAGPAWARFLPSPVAFPRHLEAEILGFVPHDRRKPAGGRPTSGAGRGGGSDGEGGGEGGGDSGKGGGVSGAGESDWEDDGGGGLGRARRRAGQACVCSARHHGAAVRLAAAWRAAVAWGRLPLLLLCLNAALISAV